MLLGLVVITLVGSYLYQAISSGLEQDRIASATVGASRLASEAQQAFDATDSTESAAQWGLFARDLVQQKLASPGTDRSRQVVLTRSERNASPSSPRSCPARFSLPSIPPDLRAAVNDNPRRQQVKLIGISDPDTGKAVPAVIVGSRVELPLAGSYDLYFVFPMQREQQTLGLITNTFAIGGIALVLLVGAVAWVVTRQVVLPVRRGRPLWQNGSPRAASTNECARGADESRHAGQVVQRDGRQSAQRDPPRGPVPGAAAIRLARLNELAQHR